MTASAMKSDREKCLESGMTDYLTKPIRPDRLFELVQKWGARSRAHAAADHRATNAT